MSRSLSAPLRRQSAFATASALVAALAGCRGAPATVVVAAPEPAKSTGKSEPPSPPKPGAPLRLVYDIDVDPTTMGLGRTRLVDQAVEGVRSPSAEHDPDANLQGRLPTRRGARHVLASPPPDEATKAAPRTRVRPATPTRDGGLIPASFDAARLVVWLPCGKSTRGAITGRPAPFVAGKLPGGRKTSYTGGRDGPSV